MQCARRVPSKNVSSSQCLYVCCCDASQYASRTACRDTASLLHGNQGTAAAASPQLHPPAQLFLAERCGCGWRWINLPRVQCLVKLAEGVQVAEALLFMLNDFKVFHICLGPFWISTRLQVWSCLVTGNMVWPAHGAPPVPPAPQNPNSSPLWPFAPWAAEALGAAGWGYRKNAVSLKGQCKLCACCQSREDELWHSKGQVLPWCCRCRVAFMYHLRDVGCRRPLLPWSHGVPQPCSEWRHTEGLSADGAALSCQWFVPACTAWLCKVTLGMNKSWALS